MKAALAGPEEGLTELGSLPGRAILVANVDRRQSEFDLPGVDRLDRLELARLSLDHGLTDWVVKKAG